MKTLIQVVKKARVTINQQVHGAIDEGYVIFVAFEKEDTLDIVEKMVKKIIQSRINKDENEKTNLSILDCKKAILSISQFTLSATLEGRRPSFSNAMEPRQAKMFYDYFNLKLIENGICVETGVFGEHMEVELINDGPFTIYIDSNKYFKT